MENNKIIILKNEYEVYTIDVEAFKWNKYIDENFFTDYQLDECDSWEELEEKSGEYLWEYVDGKVPFINYKINEEFNKLEDYEVEEIIIDNCIEYDNDFTKFKQAVLFYKMYEEAREELSDILDAIEVEEVEEVEGGVNNE